MLYPEPLRLQWRALTSRLSLLIKQARPHEWRERAWLGEIIQMKLKLLIDDVNPLQFGEAQYLLLYFADITKILAAITIIGHTAGPSNW